MSVSSPASGRRADLDWIRIGALALLILYHVGLVYTPWDWHLNSSHRFVWMEDVTLVSSPWRLTLLFLVSGAALRLMSRKYDAGEVLKARFARLAPPFLFGTLFLIPPQSWVEAVSKAGWNQGIVPWWISEFSLRGLADGVPVNHLWFVLYIAVYSLVAVALMTRPRWVEAAGARLEKTLVGWRLLVLPILYLTVVRLWLFPWFGLTNRLSVDWYNHASSLGVFLFGFLVVTRAGIWTQLERMRWVAAPLALVSLALLMALHTYPIGDLLDGSPRNVMFAINQWLTVAAVLGFGSRHLRGADNAARRYLNDAIFPCYLAHQTILVLAIFVLKPVALPAVLEAALLIAITLGGSLGVYEIVRRIDVVRPLWGLKARGKPAPPEPTPARQALIDAVRNAEPMGEAPAARPA